MLFVLIVIPGELLHRAIGKPTLIMAIGALMILLKRGLAFSKYLLSASVLIP